MPAPQGRDHFPLQGTPYSLQASAHPGFTIPIDPPLAHVLRARLEVQRPRHPTTRERPVKRLASIARQCRETAHPRILLAGHGHCHPAGRRWMGCLAGAFDHAPELMRIVNDPPTTRYGALNS